MPQLSTMLRSEVEPVARLTSPDGRVEVAVSLDEAGRPHYAVSMDGRPLVAPSRLGLRFDRAPALEEGFAVEAIEDEALDETWQPVWGPAAEIRNRYNETAVRLRERAAPRRRLALVFRAYDDGVGFRYGLPDQEPPARRAVTRELTEFRFAEGGTAWWTPVDFDKYEYLYEKTPLREAQAANTPVTVKTESGRYVALHEAALAGYPDMTLAPLKDGGERRGFRAALVPRQPVGLVKAHIQAPFATPWRTLTLGRRAGDLIESHLILNLNEPCRLEDTSWIRPGAYIGIWWAIHKGQFTWAPGSHAAATTGRAKRYVDFAAAHDIPYVLVEGWNAGWEADDWKAMDFTRAQPQYDLEEVVRYARERGVEIIAHMETGADVENMERQLEAAFSLYESLGIRAVKTGYVGKVPGHYKHDQWMVEHHERVLEKAAEYRLMIDAHEPIKPTGRERTWPHAITREAVRGMEYNAWSKGNPPSHTVTLPFTRMLAGPLDYTPGIFEVTWDPKKRKESEVYRNRAYDGPTRVHTTRAHQMALCVVLLSGLQMLADLPEHYEGAPEFAFLEGLPATWDETRVLSGEIGQYLVIARRSGEAWYAAALTGEALRTLEVPLGFLEEGIAYRAALYADAPGTDYRTRPTAVEIEERRAVTSADRLTARLGAGGGWAARFVPAADAQGRKRR